MAFDKRVRKKREFWQRFIVSIVAISTISSNCKAKPIPSIILLSSQCVHQYQLMHQSHVKSGINLNILTCRCHCDRNTASQRLWEAKENFKQFCNQYPGGCFEIGQYNMIKEDCPDFDGGYAHCLIESPVINRVTAKFTKTFRQLTTFNNDQYRLQLDENHFQFNNITYEVTGGRCGIPPEQFFIFSITDNEIEKCILNKCDFNALPIFLDVTQFEQTFQSRVILRDGICNGTYSDFEFNRTWPGSSIIMSIPSIKMTFEITNDNTVEISFNSMPEINRVTIVSSSSILPATRTSTEQTDAILHTRLQVYPTILSVLNITLKLNSTEFNLKSGENSSLSLLLAIIALLLLLTAVVLLFACVVSQRSGNAEHSETAEERENLRNDSSVQNSPTMIEFIRDHATIYMRRFSTISCRNNAP